MHIHVTHILMSLILCLLNRLAAFEKASYMRSNYPQETNEETKKESIHRKDSSNIGFSVRVCSLSQVYRRMKDLLYARLQENGLFK